MITCRPAPRSSMRRSIFDEDADYLLVLDHVRDMLEDCHRVWAKCRQHNVVNSVRTNLVKIITGLKGRGRNKLQAEGFHFTGN